MATLHLRDTFLEKLTLLRIKALNIKKALEQYSRINCIAYVLNLILTYTFKKTVLQKVALRILQLFINFKSLVEYLK